MSTMQNWQSMPDLRKVVLIIHLDQITEHVCSWIICRAWWLGWVISVSLSSSPVHPWLKSLHCVQVDVSVVSSYRKHSAHHRGDPDSTTRGGELRHILPAVHPGIKALHGAEGGVVVKAAFGTSTRKGRLLLKAERIHEELVCRNTNCHVGDKRWRDTEWYNVAIDLVQSNIINALWIQTLP